VKYLKIFKEYFPIFLIILLMSFVIFSATNKIQTLLSEGNEPCEKLPSDLYLVKDYFENDSYFYADVDDMVSIKYVGGGVFVGAD